MIRLRTNLHPMHVEQKTPKCRPGSAFAKEIEEKQRHVQEIMEQIEDKSRNRDSNFLLKKEVDSEKTDKGMIVEGLRDILRVLFGNPSLVKSQ